METVKNAGWRSALTPRRVVIASLVIGWLAFVWLGDMRYLRKVNIDDRPFETPLPIQADHRILAIGGEFSVGVKADGTVWTWGNDYKGALGRPISSQKERIVPGSVPEIEDAIAVAAGSSSAFALTKSGEVWSWGDNDLQQLGYETEKNYSSVPKKIPALENISLFSFVGGTGLAVDAAGGVIMWGSNASNARGESDPLNPRLKK